MFSSAVKLADLDDFLTPAQECVKPLLDKAKEAQGKKTDDEGRVTLQTTADPLRMTDGVRPDLIKPKKRRKPPKRAVKHVDETQQSETVQDEGKAQVSLYDCLSCAGCVTSAEAVLIEQQGIPEFLRRVRSLSEEKAGITVLSISPQSRTALSYYFKMPPSILMAKLVTFFRRLGVTYVVDMSISDAICLLELRKEFRQRVEKQKLDPQSFSLPLIASHCPGWVCYAEKIMEPEFLCHMSTVPSSQFIQGRLVKSLLLRQHNAKTAVLQCRRLLRPTPLPQWTRCTSFLHPSQVYHVCVMPCFDKKLEALRPDAQLTSENQPIPEVDTVLATSEILTLLAEECVDLESLPTSNGEDDLFLYSDLLFPPPSPRLSLQQQNGEVGSSTVPPIIIPSEKNFGSGGFAEDIFRFSAEHLLGLPVAYEGTFQATRNADYREKKAERPNKSIRCIQAYGARNIQNVLAYLRKLHATTDVSPVLKEIVFIEIMACPGGCLNGAGQIPPAELTDFFASDDATAEEKVKSRTQRLHRLEELLHARDGGAYPVPPEKHPLLAAVYSFWSEDNSSPPIDRTERFPGLEVHFESLRQKQEELGTILPSSLKW